MEDDALTLGQPHVSQRVKDYRRELTQMLEFWYGPWQTFCTWTFAPKPKHDKFGWVIPDTEIPLSPAVAEREFLRMMKWKTFRSTGYFYVTEPHQFRNVTHVHSLHKAADHIWWKSIHAFWLEKYGRFKSQPITEKRGVAFYMAKDIQWSYMTKTIEDGLWGFSPSCKWIRGPAASMETRSENFELRGSQQLDFQFKHTACAL